MRNLTLLNRATDEHIGVIKGGIVNAKDDITQ